MIVLRHIKKKIFTLFLVEVKDGLGHQRSNLQTLCTQYPKFRMMDTFHILCVDHIKRKTSFVFDGGQRLFQGVTSGQTLKTLCRQYFKLDIVDTLLYSTFYVG